MFEKSTRLVGTLYRNDEQVGTCYVEFIPVNEKTASYTYTTEGMKTDFEGYIDTSAEPKVFDVLEVNGKKYKLQSVTKYSDFYVVAGVEIYG